MTTVDGARMDSTALPSSDDRGPGMHAVAPRLPGWVFAMWIALVAVLLAGCSLDELLEPDPAPSGPVGRAAMRTDAKCFDSFEQFKAKMRRAGDGMEWHHIVGQHRANKRRLGEHDLNCTDNVIRIPTAVHRKINGYYSTKPPWAGGKTVRDFLAPQSFAEQYAQGVEVLDKHGIAL